MLAVTQTFAINILQRLHRYFIPDSITDILLGDTFMTSLLTFFRETLEEEYRRSTLASPEVEVESFLKQQEDDTFVTPQNFDHFIDQ